MDNSSRVRALATVLFSNTASEDEKAEARAELTTLAQRGEHLAIAALREVPAAQVSPQTERPAPQGVTPDFAVLLAEADEAMRAARVENERLAKVRAERRAELEVAFTSNGAPTDSQHGYRRTLEVYQSGCYSFAEETTVFEGLLLDIATRWKHAAKRV